MIEDIQQTHNDECWRWPRHHACAIRKIEQLLATHVPAGELRELVEKRHPYGLWVSIGDLLTLLDRYCKPEAGEDV